MSAWLYRLINPGAVRALESRWHRVLSGNTLVLHYRGRRSGRRLVTPVSYHEQGGALHCFAGPDHLWWRNLEGGYQFEVTLRGRRIGARAIIARGPGEPMVKALDAFLRAVPRDAPHSGVRLDGAGNPLAEDLERAAARLVHVRIDPIPPSGD